MVPPVWAKPRPAIMGTYAPHAASMGASIKDTVSPTPPVLCLSNTGPPSDWASQTNTRPESRTARVSSTRSWTDKSWKYTAMAKAAIWASLTAPEVTPSTNA